MIPSTKQKIGKDYSRPNSMFRVKNIFSGIGKTFTEIRDTIIQIKYFFVELWRGLVKPYLEIRYLLLVLFVSSAALVTFFVCFELNSASLGLDLNLLRILHDAQDYFFEPIKKSSIFVLLPLAITVFSLLFYLGSIVFKYSKIHRIHKQVDSFIVLFHSFSLLFFVFCLWFFGLPESEIKQLYVPKLIIVFGALFYAAYVFFVVYAECKNKYKECTRYTFKDFSYDPTLDYENEVMMEDEAQPSFHASIQESIKSHLKLNKSQVKVVLIGADQGQGKSYFTNQLVRNLLKGDDNDDSHIKNLFTYISLTEVNKSNDLSSLFIRRWENTLARRYPTLNKSIFSASTFSSVTGSIDTGIVQSVVTLVRSMSNRPLTRAVSRINNKELDREVADIFCNVSCVKEDSWFIVFDEIDRSPVQELYRVVEIIERFKELSKKHLPINITFILCADVNKVIANINSSVQTCPESLICRDFLFEGGKSLTLTVNLPPLTSSNKFKIIEDILNKNDAKIFLDKINIVKDIFNDFAEDLTIRDCVRIGFELILLSKVEGLNNYSQSINFYITLEFISNKYPLLWQNIINKFYPHEYGNAKLIVGARYEVKDFEDIFKKSGLDETKYDNILAIFIKIGFFRNHNKFKIFCDKDFDSSAFVDSATSDLKKLSISQAIDNFIKE